MPKRRSRKRSQFLWSLATLAVTSGLTAAAGAQAAPVPVASAFVTNGRAVKSPAMNQPPAKTVRKAERSFAGAKGPNTFRFRVANLKPGRYSAGIAARAPAGRFSKPVTLGFRIVAPVQPAR